jgi:hypothetical protein
MLIAETLSLIALDPLSGQTRAKLAALHDQRLLACALLMELAVQTRIGLRHGVVVVLDTLPSRHPLLTATLRSISRASGQLSPHAAIEQAARELPQLRDDLLDALVRRDILHPPKRAFGFFGRRNYPVRSTQAQSEGLEVLRRAALGLDTSLTALAMLALGSATGAIDQLLTFDEAEAAKSRLRQLRDEIREQLAQSDEQLDEIYAIALLEALELATEAKLSEDAMA